MSVFRFQDLAPQLPDTRNLTPDTFKLRHCPAGATFSERSHGKSIVHYAHNWNNGILEYWNGGFKETSIRYCREVLGIKKEDQERNKS